jgi:hypothetical protein
LICRARRPAPWTAVREAAQAPGRPCADTPAIRDPSACHLVRYTTTSLERDVARGLGIRCTAPILVHGELGAKSGCRSCPRAPAAGSRRRGPSVRPPVAYTS